MTPFPESEIMTIKRLEVALRKTDYKLLKDGAYKLHEKYHSGHKFEYLDLLKEIFMEVSNNASIPQDIKDLLTPTIEDILSERGISADTSTSPYEALNQNRVSSLTSLSYNSNNVQEKEVQQPEEQKISAFDAFSAKTVQTSYEPNFENSFETKPFEEFSTPTISTTENFSQEHNSYEENSENETQQIQQDTQQNQHENINKENTQYEQMPIKAKTVAIYYGQDNSNEKAKNIIKYRELISKSQNSEMKEVLRLLCEINTQTNTNVSELKNLLEQLKTTSHKINLITNSSSKNLIELFEKNELSYSLMGKNESAQTKLIPLFGLSNLFVCNDCKEKYLNKNNEITSIVLECPKCKNPMFADFYANTYNCELNLDYYNEALISLANSDVWFIVHPNTDEKTTANLLLSALKLNNKVEDIFILDKDINVRENFRSLFASINQSARINIQMSALEDFLNLVR